MNSQELLLKAKARRITRNEVEAVASELRTSTSQDPYTLIHILGIAGAEDHEDLVAGFLYSASDPMLASIALKILCTNWGKSQTYFQEVLRFVSGVEWDAEEEVRQTAISILGEALREGKNQSGLQRLIRIFEDPREWPLTRQVAYFALARAAGKSWKELPRASRLMDLEQDTDPAVLQWISRKRN